MRHKQKGLTAITWIILLGLIGIQLVLALRIFPVYLNYNTVQSIMDELETNPEVRGETPKEIRSLIYRRLQVNNITALQNTRNAFKFKKLSDGLQVSVHYEEKGPIYGNLEFVATFDHQVVIPIR